MKKIKLLDKLDFQIFYQKTKIKKFPKIKDKQSAWPSEWTTIHFKKYPRFKKIFLNKNLTLGNFLLEKALIKRKSRREFNKKLNIKIDNLAKILYFSAGIIPEKVDINQTRRFYPSAGARFPLELYIYVKRIEGLKKGLYHYNVFDHSLEILTLDNSIGMELKKAINQDWTEDYSCLFIITGIPARTTVKYGDRGFRYVCFEAGHLCQNIYFICETLNLGCCAIGGFLDDKINKIIDIDEEQEMVLYLVGVGERQNEG